MFRNSCNPEAHNKLGKHTCIYIPGYESRKHLYVLNFQQSYKENWVQLNRSDHLMNGQSIQDNRKIV